MRSIFSGMCPDCGLEPHALGCMTKAVEDGQMTPRQRQIIATERMLDSGARVSVAGREVATVLADLAREARDGTSFVVNPADMATVRKTMSAGPLGVEPDGPIVNIYGFKLMQSEAVPAGEVMVIDEARVPTIDRWEVGFDPAFADNAARFAEWRDGGNGARFISPLGVLNGLA